MGARRVLIAGASGFVGRSLTAMLAAEGHHVRALSRRMQNSVPPGVEVVSADVARLEPTTRALRGIDVAYYLVHRLDTLRFATRDRICAARFGQAARRAGVSQIVYLGALGDAAGRHTPHITSRRETAAELRRSGVDVCELRAAVIVGAGSAVIEAFRELALRSPVLVVPHGSQHRVEPIVLDDALRFLKAPLTDPRWRGRTFEIGGGEVLKWCELFKRCVDAGSCSRRMVPMPVATPRLSGLWMRVFADMPASMATAFIRNLGRDAVVRDLQARQWLGQPAMPLEPAIRSALATGSPRPRVSGVYP